MKTQDLKSDLELLKRLLGDNWSENILDLGRIEKAISNLDNDKKITNWDYVINGIVFTNIDFGKNVLPKQNNEREFENPRIKIDFNISGFNNKDIYDPINSLIFNIKIFAKCQTLDDEYDVFATWHLDKNIGEEDENFFHPEYHFHFGGHEMSKDDNLKFGQLLLLESPRLAHLPMDGILAIDFVIRNFYERNKHERLTKLPAYKKILKNAQDRFWKPYILGIASHWDSKLKNDIKDENLNPQKLIPNLV